MAVTILDVARLAGTSTATVSQALNSPRRVAAKTRRRVLAAVKKLKYYPNLHARNLAWRHSRTLGMIVSDIQNPFFPAVIRSFEARARHWGYEVIVSDTNYKPHLMRRATERMLEHNMRGVAATFFDLDLTAENVSIIKFDYSSGVYQAVEHLYRLGHRRIAFVGGQSFKSIKARQTAYVESMRKLGLEPGPIVPGNQTVEGGLAAGLTIARSWPRPTAVIAMNDLTAFGLTRAFSRSGLRIPQDVSVVGFDKTYLAEYFTPSLTTVDMHPDQLGRLAVDCLHELSSAPKPQGKVYLIPLQLVVGESTGPAPTRPRKASLPVELASPTDRVQIDAGSSLKIVTAPSHGSPGGAGDSNPLESQARGV
jgi:DNA-binding LacI/PurR family transcriptional regulator